MNQPRGSFIRVQMPTEQCGPIVCMLLFFTLKLILLKMIIYLCPMLSALLHCAKYTEKTV